MGAPRKRRASNRNEIALDGALKQSGDRPNPFPVLHMSALITDTLCAVRLHLDGRMSQGINIPVGRQNVYRATFHINWPISRLVVLSLNLTR